MGNGCTPVHIAAESGNLLVLRSLLQHGGDAQKEDKEGETALHKAARSGSEAARGLLRAPSLGGVRVPEGGARL